MTAATHARPAISAIGVMKSCGANGADKTTIVQILSILIPADQREIQVAGRRSRSSAPGDRRTGGTPGSRWARRLFDRRPAR